ncbi:MAG: LCP family protein [Clostridiales bacterium]|jgi:LCP family protein required for cell wall assembly|nr:LCP family protein [Clostridiales bacterium]
MENRNTNVNAADNGPGAPNGKGGRSRRRAVKFLITAAISVVVFISVVFVSLAAFIVVNGKKNVSQQADRGPIDITVDQLPVVNGATRDPDAADSDDGGDWLGSLIPNLIEAPRKTNVLIMGTDQGGFLSDVVVFVTFDSATKKIDFISIPRDTKVYITDEQYETLRGNGSQIHTTGPIKINELHSYAGVKYGIPYTKAKVEELLGVSVDYTVQVDIKGFRAIVDAVGGIYVDVPSPGLYYNDADQGLNIALPAGRQLLTGRDAEGLVRYRQPDKGKPTPAGYERGDVARVDMQKRFMKEFFSQVIQPEILAGNIPAILDVMYKYVKTDFNLTDVPQYMTSLDGISADNVSFYTMPGESVYQIAWYYIQDVRATDALVARTALNYVVSEEDTSAPKVRVYNGSYTPVKGIEVCESLESIGYAAEDMGDWTGARKRQTIVYASDEYVGSAIAKLFVNAKVDTASDEVPDGYEALVIVGTSESDE